MGKTVKKLKKRPALLIGLLILMPIILISVDIEVFQQRWRPEIGSYIIAGGVISHLLVIVGLVYLFVYVGSHIESKASRIFSRIGLVLGVAISALFMLGTIATGSINPVKTFTPEGYNHVYYMFPQQGWLTRRGYGIYAPVSDYTMEYVVGDVAMDYDTSYVYNDHLYIKFDGMNRLFRAESDHLYEFDLTTPQY